MAENRYCDIEAFLDTIPQYAGESGVVRAGALLEELGHPEKTLKIIHVAGSNGKGSVCAYLNRILIQHGFRTGLFTSPHLVDVRERIRIDNEMVSKSDFVQAFDRVHSAAKRLQKKNITLAYFEQKSTVDYIGAVQGIPVCFDAKECCVKTFPLANIHPHQVAFMDEFEKQKGIAFFLIYFSADNVFYYLTLRKLKEFWKRMEDGGRKSFRREELDEEFYLSGKNGFLVPYLEGIQKDLQLRD